MGHELLHSRSSPGHGVSGPPLRRMRLMVRVRACANVYQPRLRPHRRAGRLRRRPRLQHGGRRAMGHFARAPHLPHGHDLTPVGARSGPAGNERSAVEGLLPRLLDRHHDRALRETAGTAGEEQQRHHLRQFRLAGRHDPGATESRLVASHQSAAADLPR